MQLGCSVCAGVKACVSLGPKGERPWLFVLLLLWDVEELHRTAGGSWPFCLACVLAAEWSASKLEWEPYQGLRLCQGRAPELTKVP